MTEARGGCDDIYSRRGKRGTVRFRPKPIEQIYEANTITQENLVKLRGSEGHRVNRDILPRYRRLAEEVAGPLPSQVEEWLGNEASTRPWLVICVSDPNLAGAIAGRVLLDSRLNSIREGTMLNVAEFAEECDSSSRYGRGSIGNVITKWSDHQLLVIVGIGTASMPSSASLAQELSRLLERRLDRLLPTILIEQSAGHIWLRTLRKAGASASDVNHLLEIIKLGIDL